MRLGCPSLVKRSIATAPATNNRGEAREPLKLEVGDRLHGFEVVKKENIPERNIMAYLLRHTATGAEHLHLDCADSNNVFSVSFKTVPKDSTGVAHILEHTVLCGSEKYPVRDPFFNMLKRSLNTYMNAWTSSDYTMYPFSTQNEKDFKNLLSVYLDATFFPKIEEFDFMQEGHRLEFENPTDKSSPLTIKGVVFNEMKGAMSDASSVFHHALQSQLFPTTTYHHNSGGEPLDIPKLTYQQLKEFHKTHYHPSNAWFYTYGDLPLEPHLQMINEVISRFQRINPKTDVPDEQRYNESRRFAGTCPERQITTAIGYLTNNVSDVYETFVMAMLGSLLVSGPNSPMYQALIDTNIGSDYAPVTGYNAHSRETYFAVGLVGIKKEDVSLVEDVIHQTFLKVAQEGKGLEPERIESLLHQIELDQKHVTGNFGLKLISSIAKTWIHNADPTTLLHFNMYVERFRKDLKENTRFLQEKVEKYFLNNQHKVYVTLEGDPNYVAQEATKEKQLIDDIAKSITEEMKERIVANAVELKRRQEQPQDTSVLPTLTVDDIQKTSEKVEIEEEELQNAKVMWVPQPTNTITYFKGISAVSLPKELLVYLPLFCVALTSMGTKTKDYRQVAQDIESYTGGISVSPFTHFSPLDLGKHEEGLIFSSWCLERNTEKMFSLLQEVFASPTFNDKERLAVLLAQSVQSLQDSLTYQGHYFAKLQSAAGLSRTQYLKELWGGISQLAFLKQLLKKNDLDAALNAFKEIAAILFNRSKMRCSVVTEKQFISQSRKHLNDVFLSNLPSTSGTTSVGDNSYPSELNSKKFFTLPASVNFIAKTYSAPVPYIHPDHSHLKILSQIVTTCYLHKEIREKGGAYGGGVGSSDNSISFYSYRDPQLSNTLKAFEESMAWARNSSFTDEDIDQAKLGVFADIDSPVSPSQKGNAYFQYGITYDMRQKRREHLLGTTRDDLVRVAQKYCNSEASVAVLGDVAQVGGDRDWKVVSLDEEAPSPQQS